jgi:hypothetical protein
MSKTPTTYAMVADMIAAATALHSFYAALVDAGFTEDQALAVARDVVRPVGAAGE